MGLDIFFSGDIRKALLAANEASGATAGVVAPDYWLGEPEIMRAFREGYKAALTTVALAFGLSPAIIADSEEQQALQAAQRQHLLKETTIDIYDGHGTLLVERTPTGLGT